MKTAEELGRQYVELVTSRTPDAAITKEDMVRAFVAGVDMGSLINLLDEHGTKIPEENSDKNQVDS